MSMNRLAVAIEKNKPEDGIVLWWLGQAGFVIQGGGSPTVCVDPYLSDSCAQSHGLRRQDPIPIEPAQLPCDVVLASHWHPDHLDPETITPLVRRDGIVVAGPRSCIERSRRWGIPEQRLREMGWGDTVTFGHDLDIEAVSARHMVPGALCEDANGYLIRFGSTTVYHSGDTEYDTDMRSIEPGSVDVLLVCFSGTGGNLDPMEAAFLAKRIEPHLVVPMHFGMWQNETGPSPAEFVRAFRDLGGRARVEIPQVGMPIPYPPGERSQK